MRPRHQNAIRANARSSSLLGLFTFTLSVALAGHSFAQTSTWDGGGSNNNWDNVTNTGNWDPNLAPAANQNLIFGGTTRLSNNNNLAADRNFASITFNNTAGSFTLGGNRITLGGAVTNNDTDLQTINLAMILSGNRTFDAASGNINVNGILSGASGAVTKSGAGLLTLSGVNTYGGGTTISTGAVRFTNTTARPSTGSVTIAAGAGVSLGSVGAGGYTTADIDSLWAGTVTNVSLDAASLVGIDTTAGSLTYTTPNSDLGRGLAKVGTGLLNLTGTNSYTGGTRVFGGVLNFDSTAARPTTGTVTVDSGAGLSLAVGGAGYYTSTDIDALWGNTLSGVTMAPTAGVGIDTSQGDLSYATLNSNLGRSFSKVGTGTLTLTTGGTGYTGGTNVFGGKLILDNTKTGGSNFLTNGELEFKLTANQTLNGGSITGSGSLIKSGAGTLILGANASAQAITLTGANSIIDVREGTLRTDFSGGNFANNLAGLTVALGATFDTWDSNITVDELNGTGTITRGVAGNNTLTIGVNNGSGSFGGNLNTTQGTLNLLKRGTGTQTLTNSNTYNGTTTVSAGILSLGHSQAMQNSTLDTLNSVAGDSTNGLQTTVPTLTLGGLSGNKNLASVFTTTSGGYGALTGLTLNVGAGQSRIYTGAIADGAAGMTLTKTGTGFNSLNGANTYTGATAVNEGVLGIRKSATTTVTVAAGAGLALGVGSGATFYTSADVDALFSNSLSGVTIAPTSSVGIDTTAGDFTYATSMDDALVGSHVFGKYGDNTLRLTGTNTYTNGTTVNSGVLSFANNAARPASGTVTVAGGAGVSLGSVGAEGYASTNIDSLWANTVTNVTIATNSLVGIDTTAGNLSYTTPASNLTRGLAKVGANTLTLTGTNAYTGGTYVGAGRLILVNNKTGGNNFVTNGDLEFNTTSQQQLSGGTISGTGNLIKTGSSLLLLGASGVPQTVALTGASSIIDVQAGTLRNEFRNTAWSGNKAGLTIASGATFDVWDGSATVDEVNGAGTINKGFAGASTLTIGVNDGSGTFSGTINNGSGGMILVKQGIGTQILSGGNAYTGDTILSGGTLQLGSGGTTGSLTGTSSITNNANLTINRSNAFTQATDLNGKIISGTGSFTQAGAGTTTLSLTNTYTGATNINTGTLVINGNISTSSLTTVNSGGTLGGIGTLGSTSVVAGGTLAPGNSIGTLNFTNILTLAGVSNFEIDPLLSLGLNSDLANVTNGVNYGGTLNVLYGGASSNFTGGMTFNLFDATTFSGSFTSVNLPSLPEGLAWQDNLALDGSLAVIPEPSSALLLGALGTLALLRRRRNWA